MRSARRHAWPRALNVNQHSHEGSSGPADGVAGGRQGTHLEKRVRFSGPGSRGASSTSAASDERPRSSARPRPGRCAGRLRGGRAALLRSAPRARGAREAAAARGRGGCGSASARTSSTSASRTTSRRRRRRTPRSASTPVEALEEIAARLGDAGVDVAGPIRRRSRARRASTSTTHGATASSSSCASGRLSGRSGRARTARRRGTSGDDIRANRLRTAARVGTKPARSRHRLVGVTPIT